MESFREPLWERPRPNVASMSLSSVCCLDGRLSSSPSAAEGCDSSHGTGALRPVLAQVCQILGPLRGPDVHIGTREAQTRASTPWGLAARLLVQEKQEQSGGMSPWQTNCHSLLGNSCKSVFLSCSWTGLQSLKLHITHSVIPEHLL